MLDDEKIIPSGIEFELDILDTLAAEAELLFVLLIFSFARFEGKWDAGECA